jgi:hypothetical protein
VLAAGWGPDRTFVVLSCWPGARYSTLLRGLFRHDPAGCDIRHLPVDPKTASHQHPHQSMKTLSILALMSTLATAAIAADKVNFANDDTPASVLARQTGQKVELRLKSGEKLSGKVQAVGVRTVHISGLVGQEFYDAVVTLDDISAVVIRNDGN